MKKIIGALGAIAVILGALGAHSLKEVLDPQSLASFKTGTFYHIVHTVALLPALFRKEFKRMAQLFIIGIALFSGSIYLLTLDELMGVDLSFLGPVTPIGGLFFIAGWGTLLLKSAPNETLVDKS